MNQFSLECIEVINLGLCAAVGEGFTLEIGQTAEATLTILSEIIGALWHVRSEATCRHKLKPAAPT